MCYILITRLFKMVLDSLKKGLSKLWRGRSCRDSEESAQGVSSKPLQSEKQSNPMGKSKRNQQGSSSTHSQQTAPSSYPYYRRTGHMSQSPGNNAATHYPQYQNVQMSQHHENFSTTSGAVCAQGFSSTHSQQPAPSTSPYHRRTGHMSQSPGNNAVTHYPQYQKCQTSQHHDNLSTTSGAVCAQAEATIGALEDQFATQNENGGSPMYKDNVNHPPLYLEENEIGTHTTTVYSWSPSNQAQSQGKKSSSPSTPNFSPRNTMEKPPAFNGSKSSGVQQTENTNHSQEPTQVEQIISKRHVHMFDGLAQRKPATRSQSYNPYSSDNSDQGPVTRSQAQFRRSTPGSTSPLVINLEESVFGSGAVQVDFNDKSCTFGFGETPSKNIGMVKTESNYEFDPIKYIPEGFYVPPVMLKRMHSMKSVNFCKVEVKKLKTNNEKLEEAMQLANQKYDVNNVEEITELKEKIEEMYKIVHNIPSYECDQLKHKVIVAESALRCSLQELENHLSSKVENMKVEQGEHDMEIAEAEEVLSPNVEFPPDLDVPPAVAKRTQKRKDSAYTQTQIDMLREMYADLAQVNELMVETNKFCGSYPELKVLKLKVEYHNVKVNDMHHWKYKPLKQKIDKAIQDLKHALETIGFSEPILQDVQLALTYADSEINDKRLQELKNLQSSMVTLEKSMVQHSKRTVNLKPQLNEALTLLHVQQRRVKLVLDAFETFGQAQLNVKDVQEKIKKIQTVKDSEEGLSKITEWFQFFHEFESLGNDILNNHKETSCRNLKTTKENLLKAKEFLEIKEELDKEYVSVDDLANQISGFWGTMAELQTLKKQIHEKQNALSKFSSVKISQLKSILDQTLKMLSDSKNLLEDREVLIEGQSCQDGPEEESNLEADKPPDLSTMLSESPSMEIIGKFTLQLLSVHRQLSDKTVSIEQGKWLLKQLVECDRLLEHMKLKSQDERKYQTQALDFCLKLQTQVKEEMKLKQDVPVNVSSIALTALGFYNEIEEGQLNRGRARWLEVQLMDCQTRLDAIDLPEGVAREARRDVLNLCNEALKSLNALAVQHNW